MENIKIAILFDTSENKEDIETHELMEFVRNFDNLKNKDLKKQLTSLLKFLLKLEDKRE